KTDLEKKNKQLRSTDSETLKQNKGLKEHNETARKEYTKLHWENDSLKEQISDLKHEIKSSYQSTNEYFKERTNDFRGHLRDFVDKVKKKVPGSEFERLNRIEKRHEMDRFMER